MRSGEECAGQAAQTFVQCRAFIFGNLGQHGIERPGFLADFGHLHHQLVLARMGEGRMAQVVGQGDGLGQIVVQTQRMGQ